MRHALRLLLLLLALAPAACGDITDSSLASDRIRLARQAGEQDLAALVEPLVRDGATVGLAAGVLLPDGTRRFLGFGRLAADDGRVPDADTLFAIASLSKGFLAAAAASLVQEGRLGWQDTLAQRLPAAVPLSRAAGRTTLMALAAHSAGMPTHPEEFRILPLFLRYLGTGESFYGHLDRAYLRDWLGGFGYLLHPGVKYSNIGYAALTDALETATGQSGEALVQERVIAPLGLGCTGYDPAALPCAGRRARGHVGDQPAMMPRGAPAPDWVLPDVLRPSIGLHATARDLLDFAAAHLAAPQPGRPPLRDMLRQGLPGLPPAAALAWSVQALDGRPVFYQVGLVGGFASFLGIDPEAGTAAVMLQNSLNFDLRPGMALLLASRHGGRAQPLTTPMTPEWARR